MTHDTKYWDKQIRGAISWRQKQGWSDSWKKNLDYWRDAGWGQDELPYNIGRALILVLMPSLYYANPYCLISSQNPDYIEHASIVESVMNSLLYAMKVKKTFQDKCLDACLFGRGMGEIGYVDGLFKPSSIQEGMMSTNVEERTIAKNESLDTTVRDNAFWYKRILPEDFYIPYGYNSLDEAPWVVVRRCRSMEHLKQDKRYKITDDTTKSGRRSYKKTEVIATDQKEIISDAEGIEHDFVEFYEVYDLLSGEISAFAAGSDKYMRKPETYDLLKFGLPFSDISFIPDPIRYWTQPLMSMIEPQMRELTNVRTMGRLHIALSIMRVFLDRNALDPEQAKKLEGNEIGGIIYTNGDPRNSIMQVTPNLPPELLAWVREIREDVRENVGFDRMMSGGGMEHSRTTATEVQRVASSSDARIEWKREQVGLAYEDMARKLLQIVFEKWTEEQVVPVVGKDMSIQYVRFSPQQLAGELTLRADIEPLRKRTKDERTAEVANLLNLTQSLPADHSYLLQVLSRTYSWMDFRRLFPQTNQQTMNINDYQQQQRNMNPQQAQQGQQNALKKVASVA
jgi:hypothetical protein